MFEFQAPPHWQCIEFASDLHLDAATPRTADRFVRYLERTAADAVFVLGDLFEVWIGAEMLDGPGAEARIGAALLAASRQRLVGFMAGNRDFLIDRPALDRMGLRGLPDPMVLQAWGSRTLLTHGDAWCLSDTDYQRFRAEVRGDAWQQAFLDRPLEQRRAFARDARAQSEARKRRLGPQAYGDIDAAEARRQLQAAEAVQLIHGHTHKPADERWPALAATNTQAAQPAVRRHVLSDWDCEDPATSRAEILRLTPAGLMRCPVAADGATGAARAADDADAPGP